MGRSHLAGLGLSMLLGCVGPGPTGDEEHVGAEGGGPRAISASGYGAFEVSLAPMEEGVAVVWQDTRHGNAEIYARVVGTSGLPKGPEQRLTEDDVPSYAAQVASLDEQIVVAWYEPEGPTARLGSWSSDGRLRWRMALAANARNPVVVTHGGRIFTAWVQTDLAGGTTVWAGWWDRHGGSITARHLVGRASATTWNLNAAVDGDGTAYVVYDALVETQAEEIWMARVAADGTKLDRVTPDDGFASKYPDISLAAGAAALTWFDERDGNQEIYLRVGSLPELIDNLETGVQRITNNPGESIGVYVAWNAGRFGLTWCDDTSGVNEVFFQSFDQEGRALEAARQLTSTAAHSLIPAIEPWEGGFALAWNELEITDDPPHSPNARAEIHFVHVP